MISRPWSDWANLAKGASETLRKLLAPQNARKEPEQVTPAGPSKLLDSPSVKTTATVITVQTARVPPRPSINKVSNKGTETIHTIVPKVSDYKSSQAVSAKSVGSKSPKSSSSQSAKKSLATDKVTKASHRRKRA